MDFANALKGFTDLHEDLLNFLKTVIDFINKLKDVAALLKEFADFLHDVIDFLIKAICGHCISHGFVRVGTGIPESGVYLALRAEIWGKGVNACTTLAGDRFLIDFRERRKRRTTQNLIWGSKTFWRDAAEAHFRKHHFPRTEAETYFR